MIFLVKLAETNVVTFPMRFLFKLSKTHVVTSPMGFLVCMTRMVVVMMCQQVVVAMLDNRHFTTNYRQDHRNIIA